MEKRVLDTLSFLGKEIKETESLSIKKMNTAEALFEVKREFDLRVSRSEGHDRIKEKLREDELIEITFEDDTVWIGAIEDFHPVVQPNQSVSRSSTEPSVLEIPSGIEDGEGLRSGKTILFKFLRILGIKEKITQKTVKFLAGKFEDKLLEEKEGLYRITPKFDLEKLDADPDTTGRALLFIHGTASSTAGSFLGLQQNFYIGIWGRLQAQYEGRIWGFQHRTLTQSPFHNLRQLLEELPPRVSLDLVSHSRGGLVGELLVRFVEDESGITDSFIRELGFTETDKKDIEKIRELVDTKAISINRFIRVACPGGGTSLMGKRIEHTFNVLLNFVGEFLVGTPVGPVVQLLKEIIVLAVKQKNDPEVLPGLEVMDPQSPFITLINYPFSKGESGLSQLIMIAGSKSSSVNLKGLQTILMRLVFKGKNDFVVNTASMFYAAARKNRPYYFIHSSNEVHHFTYFKNDVTQRALNNALTKNIEELPEFRRQEEDWVNEEIRALIPGGRVFEDTVSKERDVVVLLPGIMGSTLLKNGKKIWIDYWRMLNGKLKKLKLEPGDGITSEALIGTAYKKLVRHLQKENYDVVTFPYDWRKSIEESGTLLMAKVQGIYDTLNKVNAQKGTDYQVSIIAHSMGGLVAREIAIAGEPLWKDLNAQSRFRLILLGTPWLGSYRIPYVLASRDTIIKVLKGLDGDLGRESKLLNIFSKYLGLLHLLPIGKNRRNNFADQEEWREFIALLKYKFEVPEQEILTAYDTFKQRIEDALDAIDYTNIVYVAGTFNGKKGTPCAYYNLNGQLTFDATSRGDESVTWDSGIPEQLNKTENLYYVEVAHGDLANKVRLFSGITELLMGGTTADPAFRRTEAGRGVRSRDLEVFVMQEEDSFTRGEAAIYADVLGISSEEEQESELPPLRVSVLNADLKMSSAPLIIGHFSRDGILRAEAAADIYLDNAITNKYRLGVYPEAENTHELFLAKDDTPFSFKGAIIVGLGELEKFTSQTLMRTVEKAMITYMLEASDKGMESLKVSSLFVGSNYGQLSLETSILSILTGIQRANAKVNAINPQVSLIEEVELVEIYKDKAIGAFLYVDRLIRQNYEKLSLQWVESRILTKFGSRSRLVMENQSDWWQRVNIESDYNPQNGFVKLKFSSATAGAREEKQQVHLNLELFRGILGNIGKDRNWNDGDAELIYEMLIPNAFKENINNRSNLLFILDENSAALPWELLQSGSGKNKPLCVNGGFIRQLSMEHYNSMPLVSKSNSALVIGDPKLENAGFASQLPSAKREAETIKEKLESKVPEVTGLIGADQQKIVRELIGSRCKILHIAAHGVFNPDDVTESGIIIGKHTFNGEEKPTIINEDFIEQLSNIPELVFINTCYSGALEMPGNPSSQERVRLAANIGIKWIAKGAKAVVITGWEVDDLSALQFANVFYDCMIEGTDFATAIKNARNKVYSDSPHGNTWGAYQCYGDPFYKLNFYGGSKPQNLTAFALKEEALNALDNLNSKIEIDFYSKTDLLDELKNIQHRLDSSNIERKDRFQSGINERLGVIYANLNQDEKALKLFEELFSSEAASFNIHTLERYFALKNKVLINEFLAFEEVQKHSARKLEIKQELLKLEERLQSLTGTTKVIGFYIQLGNVRKSLALLEENEDKRLNRLFEAIVAYDQIDDSNTSQRVFQAQYHKLILNGIVSFLKPKPGEAKSMKNEFDQFDQQFADYFKTGSKALNEEEEYWNGLRKVNRNLARIFSFWKNLKKPQKEEWKREILEGYRSSLRFDQISFRREVEVKYLRICIRFLEESGHPKGKELAVYLEEIKEGI